MFISEAYAQSAAPGAGGDLMSMLPLVVVFIIFYFLMIHPQIKRTKEIKKMVEALQKGDEVVTTGGQVGRITKVGAQYVMLEIAANTEIIVQKAAVQTLLPKGTMKSVEKE